MAYDIATLADIRNYVKVGTLVQLTVDDISVDAYTAANIDETVLQACENSAAMTVRNFLRNVYALTAPYTAEIVEIVARLTVCVLYQRVPDEPQNISDQRKELFERLRGLSKANAEEVREPERDTSVYARRSTRVDRGASMFEASGYFDGLALEQKRDRLREQI